MANNEIRNKFFDLLNNRINSKVAKDYKNSIVENALYRYATDNKARINFLETFKEYDTLPHWNPYTIRGVHYENGSCELVESEINELVNEYQVNLSNYDFGEFQNEMDKDKPFALKSFRRLLMAVNDCLEIQIINEMIRELAFSTSNEIFKDEPSKEFFEFLFHKFIKTDSTPKTAVQYVFRQFFDTGKSIDLIGMDYKITGQMIDFAEYYNSFIVDKVPKEKLKDFEISFNINDPQIKQLYLIGNRQKRNEKFNSLLFEFANNHKTVV